MTEHSPRLDLPYLQPAQAQKHVTVNEAFERLDALAQLAVQRFDAVSPPPEPDAGLIWALGASPTGVWAGQAGHLAVATQAQGWLFVLPEAGWRAYDMTQKELRVFVDGGWEVISPERVGQLGINTDASAVDRLAVVSQSSLFSHEGSGHQIKVNKAGLTDTASLLFQTNWTGHAEMGLTGSNDFAIKTSADGSSWISALQFDGADGSVSGAAVQSDPLDGVGGKLLRSGAFGLGVAADLPGNSVDQAVLSGSYAGFGSGHASPSAGVNPFASAKPFALQVAHLGADPETWLQIAGEIDGTTPRLRLRAREGGGSAASDWDDVVTVKSAVGPVSGGGLIERTDTATGSVLRYADGTQICTIKRLALAQRAASDCFGTWSFPAAFANAADLSVQASLVTGSDAADPTTIASACAPASHELSAPLLGQITASSVDIAVMRTGANDFVGGDQLWVSVQAIGRWS